VAVRVGIGGLGWRGPQDSAGRASAQRRFRLPCLRRCAGRDVVDALTSGDTADAVATAGRRMDELAGRATLGEVTARELIEDGRTR
jgi:hypothetical protein